MQPVIIETSKGFINLNHVERVIVQHSQACIEFNSSEPIWIDDKEELKKLEVILTQLAVFTTKC